MKIKTFIAAASTALLFIAGATNAATISGIDKNSVAGTFSASFNVTAINVTNLNRAQSRATLANYNAALGGSLGGANGDFNTGTFTYSGALDFGTNVGSGTTIGSFIGSGTGSSSLDPSSLFGQLQNSKGRINNGSATSTFYLFEALGKFTAGTFDIAHDDGMLVLGVGGVAGPTSVKGTRVEGFGGGNLSFLYVSTNSDPSAFRVDSDVSVVPLPAAAWMLLAGVAALGAAGRRRKAA
jgi:hypothetical protein